MKSLISVKWTNGEKSLALFTIFFFTSQILLSNTLPSEFGIIAKPATFLSFLNFGYNQFTTPGVNHILFVVSFFLLCPKKNDVIKQAVVFTGSFLLTGWLAIHQFIELNSYILHSLVLLSVFLLAVENIFARKLKVENTRYLVLFIFGLVHGAALGNSLVNTGLLLDSPLFSFFSYSAGLLLGEISILAILFIIIGKFLADKNYYKKAIVNPISAALAVYSIYSVVQLLTMTN